MAYAPFSYPIVLLYQLNNLIGNLLNERANWYFSSRCSHNRRASFLLLIFACKINWEYSCLFLHSLIFRSSWALWESSHSFSGTKYDQFDYNINSNSISPKNFPLKPIVFNMASWNGNEHWKLNKILLKIQNLSISFIYKYMPNFKLGS